MYTIKWTRLQPNESGWSPPFDTHEVHARDRREDPDVLGVVLTAISELVADLTELRCVAPVEVAVARAVRRLAAGADVSDAHEAVVRAMAAAEVAWPAATTIDSNGAPDAAISAAGPAVERGA